MRMPMLAAPGAAVIACCISAASADTEKLEHVLVSVPIHRSEAETGLPVTVLSGDQLRDRVAGSIGETLDGKPGLASSSFGPGVGQPVIRGQQGARVTVLQNSTVSADVSNSSADHAVSVEPILAESIEVLRGPATLLYGGGAIGGVVNVIDRRVPVSVPERPELAVELRHDSVDDENTGVFALNAGRGPFALHVDALRSDNNNVDIPGSTIAGGDGDHVENATDGYIPNTDGEKRSHTLGASYMFERGYIGVAVNRLDRNYGIPPGAHQHEEAGEHGEEHEEQAGHATDHADAEPVPIRVDVEQTRYDLRADVHPAVDAFDSVKWFLTYSDYQHRELEGAEVGTRWSNDSWENRLELQHRPLGDWHGVVGLQTRQFELAAVGEESFIPRTDVSRYGLFLVEDYHVGDLLFELGARWDTDELDPEAGADSEAFDSVSVSGSTLWQMDSRWSLGLALSRSERAPVIEELYSNAGNSPGTYVEHVASAAIELGDPSLTTERSRNVDLTINYRTPGVDGYVTVFHNDFADFIHLANTGTEQGETSIYAYRQQDAAFTGVEYEVTLALGELGTGTISLDLFGDWIEGDLDDGSDVSRLPPLRVGSRLQWTGPALSAYLAVLDAQEQDKPGDHETSTAGYTRWDAGIDYRIDLAASAQLQVFIKLKNLSDEDIRNATSLLRDIAPEPGRSVESGLRFTF